MPDHTSSPRGEIKMLMCAHTEGENSLEIFGIEKDGDRVKDHHREQTRRSKVPHSEKMEREEPEEEEKFLRSDRFWWRTRIWRRVRQELHE